MRSVCLGRAMTSMLKAFGRRLRNSIVDTNSSLLMQRQNTLEVLTWRIRAIGILENPPTTESNGLTADFERTERRVFVSSEWHTIPVVCRAHILEESAVGPLIVEDGQTTIFVPNDWTLTCLEDGTLRATRTHVTNFSKDNTAQTSSIDAIELAVIRSASPTPPRR